RTAEQRDELAPFHLTEMHPIPSWAGSTSQNIGSGSRAIGEPQGSPRTRPASSPLSASLLYVVRSFSSSFFVASFCGLKRRAVMLFCQFCICRICFSGSFEKVPGRRGPRLAASNFLNPRRPPSTAIVPISATIAQPSDEKTDWEPCARSVLFCSVSQ